MGRAALVFMMALFGCMYPVKQIYADQPEDPDLLYRTKCTACHRLYPPRNYTYQKLQTYVTRYGKGLSDAEHKRLLDYLQDNAKKSVKEEAAMGKN